MRPEFDERDEEIRQERIKLWNAVQGPRVGDFVVLPDGSERRFTHDWNDSLQLTINSGANYGFYFSHGHMTFSGSLDPSIPKADLTDTGESRDGLCWFFHHGYVQAHSAVYMTVPCRVYSYKPSNDSVKQ